MATRKPSDELIDVLVIGGIFREVLDADTLPLRRYGGSGLTAAIAAAVMGASVALASYVGEDDDEAVRHELRLAGVDDRSVATLPGASGTFAFPTREKPEAPWPIYRPAEATPQIPMSGLPLAKAVLCFGIPDYDPLASGWLQKSAENSTVLWDRQGWLSRARDHASVLAVPASERIYIANETEALDELGDTSLSGLLDRLPPSGFGAAVIKQGVKGVTVVRGDPGRRRVESIASFPVNTISTVGSGDVFAGVLSARLANNDSLETAARWGCAAASVVLRTGSNILSRDALGAIAELLSRER